MSALANKIFDSEFVHDILNRIYNLGSVEIRIIVVITAVLIFFLVLKKFGPKLAFAFLLAFLIGYTLYINDFFHRYQEQQADKDAHLEEIQKEVDKS